jgi:glucose-1-phosphate thymidylyltransferase
MMAGIHEILIISTRTICLISKKTVGRRASIGCTFSYAEQAIPNGLAQAFVIGEDFIGDDSVALVLGDNIFFAPIWMSCCDRIPTARWCCIAYHVSWIQSAMGS